MQKYCNHNHRCVKYTGIHLTDQCIKSSETPVKQFTKHG